VAGQRGILAQWIVVLWPRYSWFYVRSKTRCPWG